MEGLLYDSRFALRTLSRDRTFTFAAVVMLALALGLNGAVFAVVDAALFRGYPLVKANDRLVYLQHRLPVGSIPTTYLDFLAWRDQAPAFEEMAFITSGPVALRDGEGRPTDIYGFMVSADVCVTRSEADPGSGFCAFG